jgi:hypothetical protein
MWSNYFMSISLHRNIFYHLQCPLLYLLFVRCKNILGCIFQEEKYTGTVLWNILWRGVRKPDSVTSISRQRLVKDHCWATVDKQCLKVGKLKSENNRDDVHCKTTAQLAFSRCNQSLEIKSTSALITCHGNPDTWQVGVRRTHTHYTGDRKTWRKGIQILNTLQYVIIWEINISEQWH